MTIELRGLLVLNLKECVLNHKIMDFVYFANVLCSHAVFESLCVFVVGNVWL